MERDQLSRKLVVILHADVVDSTALVRLDESIAHERIQDTFQRFSETISQCGGTAHEIRGDALVAEFALASDAVNAGVDFQSANTRYIETLQDDVRPVVRVGIAMGEVVVADNTVTGEGIILAQRLEQLAEPGGVCLQGAAYDTVPKRLPFEYENLGEHKLKGFDELVRAYAVKPDSEPGQSKASATVETVALELPDEPSIAVLPFSNMSGDPDQEYFADGITEDIITALSRISGLMVIARNSTMVYKGKAVDVRQVAQEQGVRYVLEGSVRRSGNRIRVTAQLIDATTGHHLWAERYDRNMVDVFVVQDEITQKIALEMRVQISIGEKAHMLAGRTSNLDAWERLARADELSNSLVKSDNLQSRRLVEEAIQIDPESVTAWTELGWSHWADVYFGWTLAPEKSERLAREAADKALELEPDYPNGYSLLGCITLLGEDFDSALELLKKGVILAPNNAENTAELALGLMLVGKIDESREVISRAIRLSPIYPAWYLMIVGLCELLSDDTETAISTLHSAVAKEPESNWSRVYLVSALVDSGRIDEAQHLARTVISLELDYSVAQWHGARFKDPDIRAKTIENLRRAGLPE